MDNLKCNLCDNKFLSNYHYYQAPNKNEIITYRICEKCMYFIKHIELRQSSKCFYCEKFIDLCPYFKEIKDDDKKIKIKMCKKCYDNNADGDNLISN